MWPLGEMVAGSAPSLSSLPLLGNQSGSGTSKEFSVPDCRVDEERRIPHHLPGSLGTGVWPHQPFQPYLPKCPSTVKQSCEGWGAHCILFAASELFLAAR